MSDHRQLDLFAPPAAPALPAALAARDAAIESVAANADEACPGFAQRARAAVLARLACGPATAEDLTDHCLAHGLVPHDLRAFGPVLLALSRERLIVKVGSRPRRRGHLTAGGNVWSLTHATQEQP